MAFLRYRIHENGMDGRMDIEAENIIPLAAAGTGVEA